MLCKKPYRIKGIPAPCQKCMGCRFNRRRMWTHRLILEQQKHAESCFLTLTYNDENLPHGNTLVLSHYQEFLKRLRERVQPTRLRFYFVGEYGETTQRPHYHAAIFGLGRGSEKVMQESWDKGFIYLGDLTVESAQYVAGYVTKRMTNKNDPRLKGRYPEFARMSLKPGIGAGAMEDVARALNKHMDYIEINLDVPTSLKHGKRTLPLGRYLRTKLRGELGYKDTKTPAEALQRMREKSNAETDAQVQLHGLNAATKMLETKNQKLLNFETRTKIFTKKGYL